jgi:hypothetical protein
VEEEQEQARMVEVEEVDTPGAMAVGLQEAVVRLTQVSQV